MADKKDKRDKKDKKMCKDSNEPKTGPNKMYKDSKIEDTATDVYYKTKCKTKDGNVSVPTEDAVEEAKEWVDEHKM